ncbi:hypothetical protein PLICRDRAFT_152118 [Plicaturopsis crispa FD-325 SS-3]|nr:hypothetical protein PLICRDRAFT_152118 [Plicaturopsis crispa FD-325 SS-3]
MDERTTLAVHRCRFVDFTPSAITALAFPPLPLPSVKGKKAASGRQAVKFGTLAVGRANGNIELCTWTGSDRKIQSPQAWVVEKTLSGPHPSKVDSIAFTIRYPERLGPDAVPSWSDLRLFSSGGGSELIEWDIERGCVRRTISSQGGSIWSIAANPASTHLALGCEDGAVRLLSLVHDSLSHQRRFDKVKCRLLSIAWGPPVPRQASTDSKAGQGSDDSSDDDDEEDWTDSWLVTGGSDSSLRKWDVATGRVLERMGTDKMRGERTLVWTVGTLGDGTIVSGDSLGMVKFWDSRTCTQLQSFQGHGADVLCLTVGSEGTSVYTSGVDQKVAQFSLVRSSNPEASNSSILSSSTRWAQTSSRRLHSHDVRALAIWPPYTPLPSSHKRQYPIDVAPILASGGLDMSVVVTPAALPTSTITKIINPLATSSVSTFEDSYHRRLAYPSAPASTSSVKISREARLVVCMRDTSLSIWRILSKSSSLEEQYMYSPDETPQAGWEPVLDMDLDAQTNLVSSAISDDGRWLVVSDVYEAKLFKLENKNGDITPHRIRDFTAILQPHIPNSSSTGGSAFCFSPDSSKLVMSTTLTPYVLVLDLSSDKPHVLRRFDHHRTTGIIPGERIVKKIGRESADDAPMEDGEDEVSNLTTATISRMAISADGQWLATTDDRSRTHIFHLDSIKHHCALPSFPHPVHALSFNSSHPNMLVLGFPNNTLQIFDVEARQFPEWSRALSHSPPVRFSHAHDPMLGVAFDIPTSEHPEVQYALFWGSTWLCQVRLDTPEATSKKRRRHANGDVEATPESHLETHANGKGRNFKMITHYRPILFVDFIARGELVIVERPLVDILATLPPAYFKPKYGLS